MLCFGFMYFNAVHAFRNVMTPKMLSLRETILKSPLGKIFYTHQKCKLKHLTLFAEASVFENHAHIPILSLKRSTDQFILYQVNTTCRIVWGRLQSQYLRYI